MKDRILSNQSGQSLIQVLIGFALVGVLLTVTTSLYTNMARENRSMGETLAAYDVQRILTAAVSREALCTPLIEDANLVTPAHATELKISELSAEKPVKLVLRQAGGAKLGGAVSPLSTSLFVEQSDGIQMHLTGPNTADLVVRFDSKKSVRPVRDIVLTGIPVCFGGDVTAAKLVSCGSTTCAQETTPPPKCTEGFTLSEARAVITPWPGGAQSMNGLGPTVNEICKRLGCADMKSATTTNYHSCRDNWLATYNGTSFVRVNACTAGNRMLDPYASATTKVLFCNDVP